MHFPLIFNAVITVNSDLHEYDTNVIYSVNSRFDRRSLRAVIRRVFLVSMSVQIVKSKTCA